MSKRLCIIPCGSKKIWDKVPNHGPTIASDVYIGTFGKACQAYASAFFDEWVILSAKHGFLFPTDVVYENYDISFSMKHTDVISINLLLKQVEEKRLNLYDEIVVLGGKKYHRVVEQIYDKRKLTYPLANLKGIGYMVQKLQRAVIENKEISR